VPLSYVDNSLGPAAAPVAVLLEIIRYCISRGPRLCPVVLLY
jgi:hypothetical protein